MVTSEIQADLETIENNSALYEETNFNSRVEALDYLEFNVLDRIEGLLQVPNPPETLMSLKQSAERVKRQLEDIDEGLFQRLRADIRRGGCSGPALKSLIAAYVGRESTASQQSAEIGYDSLDVFINGLLLTEAVPGETRAREPEMVYYQQTPARVILELIEKAQFTGEDVFYDLGSGLGQVPILVNLLSGAKAKGVEFEPAYCDYAKECAANLNLTRAEFINADARAADYADGTVFFMYTPFEGSVLQNVLDKLRGEAQKRTIRLFTYGPCTLEVARQDWLRDEGQGGDQLYKLGGFRSL